MDSLALVFSSGWASGVNSYLVVLVLGIAEKVGSFEQIPDLLGRWDVLAVATVLYVVEFFADKIPYVDSVWDIVSTVIRPFVGGAIGVLIGGDSSEINGLVGGSVGGTTALASHFVKAGTRLAVNTSPEPGSNIAVSVTEDVVVLALVWFAIEHPYIAASIAAVLLICGLAVLYLAAKVIRRSWLKLKAWWRRRRDRRSGAAPAPG